MFKGGTEATFGANKFGGMLGTGKTVDVPTGESENYPIDELVEKLGIFFNNGSVYELIEVIRHDLIIAIIV